MDDLVQIDTKGTTEHIGIINVQNHFAVQQPVDFQPVKSGSSCEFDPGDTLFGGHPPQDVTHRRRKTGHARRGYADRNQLSMALI
jgi:hypothetical protein